ncbi:hypothetical protein [Salipiger sp. CCB-MM3]|uniref:hypothetical protein n=1 Tax=Salipiger sp. CCB-MM3 TaxID=1792508 RepID=UPI0012F9FDD2|nr:hypothetical protein [Salipiger sp. CCB-MM3]
MIWVPIVLGLFKFTVLGTTFVLCIKSQREGEREDRRAEEARMRSTAVECDVDASEPDVKAGG